MYDTKTESLIMNDHTIPTGLRHWFVAHFIIDILFAMPLILFPALLLQVLGFETTNLLLARLVGAALVGIGGVSFIMHKKDISEYRAMLQLKLLWSGTAIVAIILSFKDTDTSVKWFLLEIFIVFFLVWGYYFKKLSKK